MQSERRPWGRSDTEKVSELKTSSDRNGKENPMSEAILAKAPLLQQFSPRKMPGAMLAAAGVHAFLALGVMALVSAGWIKSAPMEMQDSEIGYEILDEAPAANAPKPMPKVQPVAEVKPVEPTKTDVAARELQDAKSDVVGTSQAAIQQPAAMGGEGSGSSAAPYYKIKPKYPRAALVAGDEGWILLKIDVREDGSVDNVRVVGGEKRNMFQDEARRAVAQWKYRPFLDANGNALRVADHQVRVDFNLANR